MAHARGSAATNQYNNDDMLQNFQDAGMLEFANEMSFFQDSRLPPARPARDGGTPSGSRPSPGMALFASPEAPTPRNATPRDSGPEETPSKKKKRVSRGGVTDKNAKGLRHFSWKVCEKVKELRHTSYNEVANDLVKQFSDPANNPEDSKEFEEKNIRRRVYDALNVLMALNIILKEKDKVIVWRGFPEGPGGRGEAEAAARREEAEARERLAVKQKYLEVLKQQYAGMRSLVQRNQRHPAAGKRISLPFIFLQTAPDARVDVDMSADQDVCSIDFGGHRFAIHDDNDVLQSLSLGVPTEMEPKRIKSTPPQSSSLVPF